MRGKEGGRREREGESERWLKSNQIKSNQVGDTPTEEEEEEGNLSPQTKNNPNKLNKNNGV